MPAAPSLVDLVDRVSATTGLPPAQATRIVDEILDAMSEPVEAYVRRRHRELHERGARNEEIWPRLVNEVGQRRFPAALSERQIRRLVYG